MKSRRGTKRRSWRRHRAPISTGSKTVRREESLQPVGGESTGRGTGTGTSASAAASPPAEVEVEAASRSCQRGEGDGGRRVCLHQQNEVL